jgi:hypothetical protein
MEHKTSTRETFKKLNEFEDSEGNIWLWDDSIQRYVKSQGQQSQGQENK